jgi:methionyl-tRNA formyltransferase
LIRGLAPYPTAWFLLKDKEKEMSVKVYESAWQKVAHDYKIGMVISDKNEIKVAVVDGFVHFLALQFPGKRKMSSKEILNGTSFSKETTAW